MRISGFGLRVSKHDKDAGHEDEAPEISPDLLERFVIAVLVLSVSFTISFFVFKWFLMTRVRPIVERDYPKEESARRTKDKHKCFGYSKVAQSMPSPSNIV